VVRLLLDKGALRNEKDADGYTALIWASLYGYGHTEVMRLLLDKLGRAVGALLDEKKEGDTALIMGSRRGHTEVW
jgi:ankyrin repeat protein